MIQFFYFIHILVRKHVKASEISSVKPFKIVYIKGFTDTDSSLTLVRFKYSKPIFAAVIGKRI